MLTLFRRNLFIRAVGLGLLAGAAACLHALFGGSAVRSGSGVPVALEAAAGFLGTSLGAVLLLLGRHIHDRVALSARWSRSRRWVPPGRRADQPLAVPGAT